MKIRTASIFAFSFLILSGSSVWAGPVGIQRTWSPNEQAAAVSALKAKRDEVGQQMPEPPKGPELARYVTRLERLDDLINRIQNGQPVSTDEINQQVQAPSRG